MSQLRRRQIHAQPGGLLRYSWENASEFQPALGKADALLAWLSLQPNAENIADHNEPTIPPGVLARWPFWSGKPQVGAVRQEGDGAHRFLICSVCSTEWAYGKSAVRHVGKKLKISLRFTRQASSPCSSRALQHLPPLHQDRRPHQERPCGSGC